MTDPPMARVLIVEDEALIAMLIEDMLLDFGCQVAGSAAQLEAALALAREGAFDFGIIDVNLGGTTAYPVAQVLRERGIPFAFVTGYGAAGLDPGFSDAPVLQKPFRGDDLAAVVRRLRGANGG